MLTNYMGILNLNEDETNIISLTKSRPLASVPIGAKYRIIDFTLSNMINSGLRNIGVFTQSKSRSLVDHLGSGKPWDLDRRLNGLFVFNYGIDDISINDTQMLWNNMEYIYRSKEKNVILCPSYMVANIDYVKAVAYHEQKNQDITIIYKSIDTGTKNFLNCDVLNIDANNNVLSIGKNIGTYCNLNISMEMFIMKKDTLISLISKCVQADSYCTITDVIYDNVKNLNVTAYEFTGYLQCINSISAYYKANMSMLNLKITKELFFSNGPIYTKIKDESPTKYSTDSRVKNSIIADGCIIEGIVENSIISPGVVINKGAKIRNSIIFQNCKIKENCNLSNIIMDKGVIIEKNKFLNGDEEFPLVIEKRLLFKNNI